MNVNLTFDSLSQRLTGADGKLIKECDGTKRLYYCDLLD